MAAKDEDSLLDRIRASIRCNRDDLAIAACRAKSAWRRRDLGPSPKAPTDFRAGTASIAHARHAASDYDERAMRAIANLREVDERLLTEGARRFTRAAAVFVAPAIFAPPRA
jgi:hypothetical protein